MDFPITRFDPGKLPEPPDHLTIAAASWWWRLAAWAKVRNKHVDLTLERLEDVALLLARADKLEPRDAEVAIMNENIQLAEAGFNSVDLQHLDIPEHEVFADHKKKMTAQMPMAKPD